MDLTTGKIAEVMFESALDTYEQQDQLLPLVSLMEPDSGTMQNANNVVWRPVEQHAPILEGWDLTGLETGIIEETYPAILGTPTNDFVQQRADDLRSKLFWERRGRKSGQRQASELNQRIAQAIAIQGSLFYNIDIPAGESYSGYNFIARAQATMNERQLVNNGRSFILNDRDTLIFSADLAGRQTLQGRPETAWAKGQIGQNVAEFDVYTGSYLPSITGDVSPDTTVTADLSFKPEGGSVDEVTGQVTNVDYRVAEFPVVDSSDYNVGDKFHIPGCYSVGLDDKSENGELMKFTIVAIPDGTTLTVYPKPIAINDPALSALEQAYGNTDSIIPSGAVITRLNIYAWNKTNLFFDKEAVEVTGGEIPAGLFSEYDGMKVIQTTMKNGLNMYMVYDGDIATMNFRYRLFTWYGVTVANPSACGVATTGNL